MFLVPYSTDAPLYHLPIATVGLIVVNVICFAITGGGNPVEHEAWLLEYGHIDPVEWISCAFFHFGFSHLFGNMFFLWAFGLIVEGKLGIGRFLVVYFIIMILHAGIEQFIMLGQPIGGSAGASGVIYGLLAMAVVWAPRNDMHCFGMIFLRPFTIEVSIAFFGIGYLVLQFVFASLHQFEMSSEVIHLLGAVVGGVIGVTMLKTDLVDCDNWDIFNVMRGTHTQTIHERDRDDRREKKKRRKKKKAKQSKPASQRTPEEHEEAEEIKARRKELSNEFVRLLKKGPPQAAFRIWKKTRHYFPDAKLSANKLNALIQGLYKKKQWSDVVPLLEEFIERFPDRSTRNRIRLAFVLLDIQKRPRAALNAVEPINESNIKEDDSKLLNHLKISANELIEDGVIELKDKAW